MIAWEYQVVQVAARAKGDDGHTRIHEPIAQRLDRLGREGWELAGVSLLEDPLFSLYIFKRPSAALPAMAAANGNGLAAD